MKTIQLDGFENLKYDDALAEKGKAFEYEFGGRKLAITSRMIGPSNTAFQEARSKSAEKQADAKAMGMEWSDEAKSRSFLGDTYDTCITGWSGFEVGGEELPLTRDNWIGIMGEPKVGRRIFTIFTGDASDAGEFLPSKEAAAEGNSPAP